MKKLRAAMAAVALVCVCAGAAAGEASAAPGKIAWSKCFSQLGPFECGTVQVPLDYDSPNGATISIALVRLPATDPAHRIGSLFLNPGGPGGSGVDYTVFAGPFLYTDEVRAKFDLVGFDPRGTNRSTALRCFGTDKQWGPYFTPFAFPSTPAEEEAWMNADLYLDSNCAQRGGRIADHMATADVARDLDVLREAVGDAKLTYAGVSYGTFLGQTYANMFPNNVRALIIDGVLDPIAWTTGTGDGSTVPFSTRLRSDAGAQATLDEFFRLCDAGGANCAFGPDSAARFAALGAALKIHPLPITFPDGSTGEVNYSILIGDDAGCDVRLARPGSPLPRVSRASRSRSALRPWVSAPAVLASDERIHPQARVPALHQLHRELPCGRLRGLDNPHSYGAWSTNGAAADAAFGYFGRLWTWASSICAAWPNSDADRYMGPFTNATANPVLVIGNLFDPATRYQGAVIASNLLPNSRLLTVHGWGHTSLFLSSCADAVQTRYLVDLTLPAARNGV